MEQSTNVQILLAVRNGAQYLPKQLASITAQQHRNWTLLIGDDGSTDGAAELARAFAQSEGDARVNLLPGPQQGMATNFLTLLRRSAPGSAVAFCDQDDVWMPHKLGRALEQIGAAGDDVVAYTCRTIETDADMRPLSLSPWPNCGPSFGNALVQNILAGNALVLSPPAADLLRRTASGAIGAKVPFHDWWAYLFLAGAGGRIVLDPEPGLYYRQHSTSMHGAARGLRAGLMRGYKAMMGQYSDWVSCNISALKEHEGLLTPSARATLSDFAAARTGPRRALASHMASMGIRRQTENGDRALRILARMGRL